MSSISGYEYEAFVAEFYDLVYETIERMDFPFYEKCAGRQAGKILELGCGTGRILIPLARAGYQITGLDASPHMLKVCEDKVAKEPKPVQEWVTLILGNMTEFNIGEEYSLVTTPFRSFQHLITVEEQKACLKCVYKHLLPGGWLILDVFNPYLPRLYDQQYLQEIEDIKALQLPDGRSLRRTCRTTAFHRDLQYKDEELIYYLTSPDGSQERKVHAFPMRYFFRYELEHLLELCDFRLLNLYGDFNRNPYANDSPELIMIAEKR